MPDESSVRWEKGVGEEAYSRRSSRPTARASEAEAGAHNLLIGDREVDVGTIVSFLVASSARCARSGRREQTCCTVNARYAIRRSHSYTCTATHACGGRRLAVTRAHLAPMHHLGARFPALRVLALSCIRDQPFTNSHSSVPQVVTSVSYTTVFALTLTCSS